MLEDLYVAVKAIDTFTFAKEYYFQGYYNLFSSLKKMNMRIDSNPYRIFYDKILNNEYENYLKEKI